MYSLDLFKVYGFKYTSSPCNDVIILYIKIIIIMSIAFQKIAFLSK
jgi:hypothetical protein